MATIPVDLFLLWQEGRFVSGFTNDAPPTLPAITAGDTWALRVFYIDSTTPRRPHRFAGSSTLAQFIAAGNNHVYASGTSDSEIAPATGLPTVTRTNSGSGLEERQRVQFPSTPQGRFKMSWGGGGIAGGGVGPQGYTDWINTADGIAGVQAAIRAMHLVKWINNPPTAVSGDWTPYIVVTGTISDFTIAYQQGAPSGGPGIVPLATFSSATFEVEYEFGWNVSVPLTAGDFNDLFLPSIGPAYFQVYLNGGFVSQIQLTSSPPPTGGGGDDPNIPFFTNGPPPTSAIIRQPYSFLYLASGLPPPSFSLLSGALPPGISLSSSGQLSGVPTVLGPFSGVVRALNSAGSATQVFNIVISSLGPSVIDTSRAIYDGDYTVATPHGGLEKHTEIENQPFSLIYRHKYHQFAAFWEPQPLGTPCPYDPNFQLVFETPRVDVGGSIVEWTREWALIPPAWKDAEIVNYPVLYAFQNPANGNKWYLINYTVSRKANVTHSYYPASDPSTIPVKRLPRAFVIQDGALITPDGPTGVTSGAWNGNPVPGQTLIAQDDDIRHYRGNIWERIERYIRF